ncbi:MAG: hypothetical protein K0S35_2457 [Geminicoccaceae bacterium]|jgi:hypothetical protein|nr:hypothetical protein [Geminicoccaceae bacterium]
MRVTIATEGGIAHFPGLAKPVTIEPDELDPGAAARLGKAVQAARFFDQPPQVGRPKRGAADYRQHTVTVERDGRQHTVRILEPIDDPALQELVRLLQAEVREQRAKARGSSPAR